MRYLFFLLFLFINILLAVNPCSKNIILASEISPNPKLETYDISKNPNCGYYNNQPLNWTCSGNNIYYGGYFNCNSLTVNFSMTVYHPVSSCPDGQIVNQDGVCKLPECPANMELSSGDVYCVPIVCPIGTEKDPSTKLCKPKTCPKGQTLINDGTCQTTCPPNSARVGKICKYTCSAYSYQQCGQYLSPDGQKCVWSVFPNSFFDPITITSSEFGSTVGQCKTATDAFQDEIHNFMPGSALPIQRALPKLPSYEPQPLQKPIPANNPNYVPVPKPVNNPDYVPPVTPTPVKPIEPIPVPAFPINPNDPNYVPEPVIPLPITPNIAPYSPPAPAPAPEPLPAPETLPLPAPELPTVKPYQFPYLPVETSPASGSTVPTTNPNYVPPVIEPIPNEPSTNPDPNSPQYPSTSPIIYPETSMPDVPDLDYFTLDDLDKFRYDITLMADNFLSQIDNAQTTFSNTYNILNNGFEPISLPTGGCGGSLSFSALGKTIDLCPPMTSALSQFSPLFQLITFLIGFIISIRIFLSGLRD